MPIAKGVIDHDTLRPGLRELYRAADFIGGSCSQSQGCTRECRRQDRPECCRERNFTEAEFGYIAAAMPARDLYAKANRYVTSQHRHGWCPFLGDDGRCEVWNVRPLECRVIGTLEARPDTCAEEPQQLAKGSEEMREALYRLLAVIAGEGPRRPLAEWLLQWKLNNDVVGFQRRMPGQP